jgi:glycosyltransferase involved in cell wall biosynthesis
LRTQVERFLSEYRLVDSVTLWGPQPHHSVSELMSKADAFLQHSRRDPSTGDEEGLPVAILEAMAHGLPVVATRHGGIPEAVLEGITGSLVPEGDTTGMAKAMENFARDPASARSLGVCGWKRAQEHFSIERQCARLSRLLSA